jgi:hypothetical protein
LVDPRRALEDAARERRGCRIGRVGGELRRGALCRLDAIGLVCVVPGHDLRGGEEVRLWFEEGNASLHFEATVARTGVPVPDRSGDGLLLGFLAAIPVAPAVRELPTEAPSRVEGSLELQLATGSPISLLEAPVELVSLGLDRVEFQVPRGSTLLFPEQGTLRLRLGSGSDAVSEAQARVASVVVTESHRLYQLTVEGIDSQPTYARALAALAARTRG